MTVLGGRWGSEPARPDEETQGEPALWADLARRIEQGDRDAEAELALRFHARVRALASSRLHGSDAALDIAQETILAVLEALRAHSLREPEKLPAFVLSIARNLINGHLRTQARRRETSEDSLDIQASTQPGFAGLDEQRRSLVREALRRLKPLDRRILLLTLVEGMTPREIGPIVGLAAEAVRTRKARAVKAITGHIRKVTRKRRLAHIAKSGPRP